MKCFVMNGTAFVLIDASASASAKLCVEIQQDLVVNELLPYFRGQETSPDSLSISSNTRRPGRKKTMHRARRFSNNLYIIYRLSISAWYVATDWWRRDLFTITPKFSPHTTLPPSPRAALVTVIKKEQVTCSMCDRWRGYFRWFLLCY